MIFFQIYSQPTSREDKLDHQYRVRLYLVIPPYQNGIMSEIQRFVKRWEKLNFNFASARSQGHDDHTTIYFFFILSKLLFKTRIFFDLFFDDDADDDDAC